MKENSEKLSIVIPVYNSEKYLEACISSILNQTYQDIEIILIDDGSKDNSWNICQKLQSIDQRITAVHIENNGASNARNIGLQYATGKYLTFVDSDDFLCSTTIYESVINVLQSEHIDMVVFGWRNFDEETNECCEVSPGVVGILSAEEVSSIIINDNILCGGGYPWNKIWKTDKLKNTDGFIFKFNTELFAYEDKLFVLECLSLIDQVQIISDCGYNYRIIRKSLSHDNLMKREIHLNGIRAYGLMEEFFKGLDAKLEKEARNYKIRLIIYRANSARKEHDAEMTYWCSSYLKDCMRYIFVNSGIDFHLRLLWVINYVWQRIVSLK